MEPLQVEAVYEAGLLKPDRPLPLEEHQRVQISIIGAVDVVQGTAGLLGWKGDAATLERIAMDAEFSAEESP